MSYYPDYSDFSVSARYEFTISSWVAEIYHLGNLVYETAAYVTEAEARLAAYEHLHNSMDNLLAGTIGTGGGGNGGEVTLPDPSYDYFTIYALADGSRGEFLTNTDGQKAKVQKTTQPGSSFVANLNVANIFHLVLDSSNCQIQMTGAQTGYRCWWDFVIRQSNSGGVYNRTISFLDSINWEAGTAAKARIGQNAATYFSVYSDDGGTTKYGLFDPTDLRRSHIERFNETGSALATGDGGPNGHWFFIVPESLNGCKLYSAHISFASDVSATSGPCSFNLHNATTSNDMLSTNITVDDTEYSSRTADASHAVNATYAEVSTHNRIRLDVDNAGDGPATPIFLEMIFNPPG